MCYEDTTDKRQSNTEMKLIVRLWNEDGFHKDIEIADDDFPGTYTYKKAPSYEERLRYFSSVRERMSRAGPPWFYRPPLHEHVLDGFKEVSYTTFGDLIIDRKNNTLIREYRAV